MSKRFQPMREFGKIAKKPKLDISINKKNSNARDNIHSLMSKPQSNADLWDDDEDDVILLASQVVESKIAASTNNQTITESEVTFSEFQPRVQQHSTQRQSEPQIDFLSQMLDDDDDDFVRLAAAVEKDTKNHTVSSAQVFGTSQEESMTFKKPELPKSHKSKLHGAAIEQPNVNMQNIQSELEPSSTARRQLATERQIQFLMERLDAMKQENAKLNKDLDKVKENMEAKSGEASMLRDELRRAKQQVDNLKMEKLLQTEAVNAESKLKIEQLSKEVELKENELKVQRMQHTIFKMRHASESSKRHEISTITADDESEADKKFAQSFSMMQLRNFNINPLPHKMGSVSALLTKDAFERADERGVSKKFNTFFQQELENIQLILAQIQLKPSTFDSQKLTESVRKVFSEFWSYVHTLKYNFYEKVQPYHNYDVMADNSTRAPGCLLLKAALYDLERAINLRRYIAALSAVFQQSECAARLILNAKHEDYPLLQIVIDAVIKLGFSDEMQEHFGVIEACSVLVHNILLHLKADLAEDKDSFELIFQLLKYLTFTRPNPFALYELSFSVLDCAQRNLPILSKLCENSERRHFEVDRFMSVYRFTNDACFLQVYCGLLESMFPLYTPLSKTQFEMQIKICLNHLRFVFNCLTEPPHFVRKMLSLNNEDDEKNDAEKQSSENIPKYDERPSTSKQAAAVAAMSTNTRENISNSNNSLNSTQNSTTKSANITCDCFTQMCLSIVTMIWLTLRQWFRMDKEIETERVGLISRIAVHLLYLMFCDNYHACLFRDDEDTTKHYFYLICTWWQDNAAELQFSKIQLNLLQKLSESYAMPKLLKDEEVNLENIKTDLKQWCQMTNDNDCDVNTLKDGDSIIKDLRLLDDIFDPNIFFASIHRNKS